MRPFVTSMLVVVWRRVKNCICESHYRITLPATKLCRLERKYHYKII